MCLLSCGHHRISSCNHVISDLACLAILLYLFLRVSGSSGSNPQLKLLLPGKKSSHALCPVVSQVCASWNNSCVDLVDKYSPDSVSLLFRNLFQQLLLILFFPHLGCRLLFCCSCMTTENHKHTSAVNCCVKKDFKWQTPSIIAQVNMCPKAPCNKNRIYLSWVR